MIKRILIYVLLSVALFFGLYISNGLLLESSGVDPQFSLLKAYIYNLSSTIIIYVLIELVVSSMPNQAGLAYLSLVCVKLGVFILLFKGVLFTDIQLEDLEKYTLVFPVLIFLFLEAAASFRLLNRL